MKGKDGGLEKEKVYDLDTELLLLEQIAPNTPKKILLLEDDGSMALPLIEYLEANQFKVTLVGNGVDGLKEIMAADFDIIICDMLMPHLPGDMFYLAVERTKPHLCHRFLFMTGHKADPRWDDFVRKVGGVMLWKPFKFSQLKERINFVLNKAVAKSLPMGSRPHRQQPAIIQR